MPKSLRTTTLLSAVLVLTFSLAPLAASEVVWVFPPQQAAVGFSSPKLIDYARTGGEPVIASTSSGRLLVAAHPGWTLADFAFSGLSIPSTGQAPMYASDDNGLTWTYIGLTGNLAYGFDGTTMSVVYRGPARLPHEACPGLSDPDFAVAPGAGGAADTVYFAQLPTPRHAALSRSTDGGQTWECRNELLGYDPAQGALPGGFDRVFLAAGEGVLYATAFPGGGVNRFLASTDGGITWSNRANVPCQWGDPTIDRSIANGHGGRLYYGCGSTLYVSDDGASTWTTRSVPGAAPYAGGDFTKSPVALDGVPGGSRYVWTTWRERSTADYGHINVAFAPADGSGSFTRLNLSAYGVPAGNHVMPNVVAGSHGKAAVVWYGTTGEMTEDSTWNVYAAFITGAGTLSQSVTVVVVTPEPVFKGVPCTGLGCSWFHQPTSSSRVLGELLRATVDPQGWLHVAYTDAYHVAPGDEPGQGHVGYVRQTSTLGAPRIGSSADFHHYS